MQLSRGRTLIVAVIVLAIAGLLAPGRSTLYLYSLSGTAVVLALALLWYGLFPPRTPPAERVSDSRLGELVYDEDHDAWRATVQTVEGPFTFVISGTGVPDEGLIRHAADIVAAPVPFMTKVRKLLEAEAEAQPRWAGEIRQLKLDEVMLFWPKRVDDGMLFFTGPAEDRLWRCDYVRREPMGLGFDS